MDQQELSDKNKSRMIPLSATYKWSALFASKNAISRKAKAKWGIRNVGSGGPLLWATWNDFKDGKGINSLNPQYVKFKVALRDFLNENFKTTVNDDGFAVGQPIVGNFDALEAATGVPMYPLNTPPSDNLPLLNELGIETQGFKTKRHQKIFECIFDCMFGTYKPANTYVSKPSSSTFPFHLSGEESWDAKIGMANKVLGSIDVWLDLIAKGDWIKLAAEYKTIMCYILSVRHQPERGSKDRRVNLEDGTTTIAEKYAHLLELGVENASAMRVRTVYGLCGVINYVMSTMWTARREHYFHEYAATWHHTGPDQLFESLKGLVDQIGLDVTQMDQTVPRWFLEAYTARLPSIMDDRIAKLVSFVNGAPYFAAALGPNSTNFLMGDPFDQSTWDINVGLASGRWDNPDIGKLWMTFVYASFMDDVYPWFPDGEYKTNMIATHRFLKGKDERWTLLDMGDDAIAGAKTKAAAFAMRGHLKEDMPSPYAKLDLEFGLVFLGNVVYKDKSGILQRPAPNPITYIVNRYCPERGITDRFNRFWGFGFDQARIHYEMAGPIITELRESVDMIWNQHVDYATPAQCAAEHRARVHPNFPVASLSPIDREVMMDPSKLRWKFRPDEVSEDVINLNSWSIKADFIDASVGHLNKSLDLGFLEGTDI